MAYILRINEWHVGPFPTHLAAQDYAERHGCDDYELITLDDPIKASKQLRFWRRAPIVQA